MEDGVIGVEPSSPSTKENNRLIAKNGSPDIISRRLRVYYCGLGDTAEEAEEDFIETLKEALRESREEGLDLGSLKEINVVFTSTLMFVYRNKQTRQCNLWQSLPKRD